MPYSSVYGTLVLRRLLSLSESVAHRCEKFFHGWNGLIKKATGLIKCARVKGSSISFYDFSVLRVTTRRDGLRRETLRRRKV